MKNKNIEQRLLQLPEILACKNLIQNEYHQFDVYDHTLAVVDALGRFSPYTKTDLVAAAYLHDIGKPVVAKPRIYDGIPQLDTDGKQRHTFPNHEMVGAQMVMKLDPALFKEFDLDQKSISKLVELHYNPMKYAGKLRKAKNFGDFKKDLTLMKEDFSNQNVKLEDLMALFAADSIGKGDTWGDLQELLAFREVILGKKSAEVVYQMQKIHGGTKYGYEVKE